MSHGSCVRSSPGTTPSSIDHRGACFDSPSRTLAVNAPAPIMAGVPTDSVSRRRFAVACGVLSQYVRAGGPVTTAAMPAATTPAPLFLSPTTAGAASLQPEAGTAATANTAPQQLTIFYGGRVVVLDACPPEKAAELIRLAAAAQAAPAPEAPALVDMPIARKASLRRFLAKRKDRSSFSTSSAAAYDRQDGEEPEQQQPAAKKGKVVATREEASPSPSSSWLALGLGGPQGGMLGR